MTKKIGLVGAGYICEYHAKAIVANTTLELVGVTDLDHEKARFIAEQFDCRAFESLEEMVKNGAEAIHILTPPNSHIQLATLAMQLGCDVLVEKPLAEDAEACKELKGLAASLGKQVCVNHSLLFDPQIIKAKKSINSGKIGNVVSVDILRSSVYPTYAGGTLPPQYRDGGYPFRDLGIHCLYLLEHFLGNIKDVDAKWQSLGGDKNLAFDEWSAMVECSNGMGRFQLSWNVKPLQNLMIIQGTKGVLRVDSFLMFNSIRKAIPAPKVFERITNNYTDSLRPIFEMPVNIVKFATGKIVPYQGLTNLINEFYSALEQNKPIPVSIDKAIPSVHWVEHIAKLADKEALDLQSASDNMPAVDVLVTGGTGGLGSNIVSHLLSTGKTVRVLARSLPSAPFDNVQYMSGSLGNPAAVDKAVKNVSYIIHAGAAMQGDENEHICSTETGTINIINAAEKYKIKKLIHISSLSVVDWAGNDNRTVDESADFEPNPNARGYYTQYKLKAEKLITDACNNNRINAVILRPGQIFGGKIPLVTGAVARRAGNKMVVFGDGEIKLPLIYIDDVSDAVIASIDTQTPNGEILHLTDNNVEYTQNQLLEKTHPNNKVIRIPRKLMFTMGGFSEKAFKLIKRQSPFARYRLESAMPRISFKSDRAKTKLNWTPKIGVNKGIDISTSESN